jgi:hypothetical protein
MDSNEPKVIITLELYNTLLAAREAQRETREMDRKIFVAHMQVLIPAVQGRITARAFTIDWTTIDFNRTPTRVTYDSGTNDIKFEYRD